MVAWCADHCRHLLTSREDDFIHSMQDWKGHITLNQFKWVVKIFDRLSTIHGGL